MFLVHRCPLPCAAAGVRTRIDEALADPLPLLHCVWILFLSYHNQWTHQAPRKVLEWVYVVWSGGRRVEPSTEILAQYHQGHVREASLFNAEQSHT